MTDFFGAMRELQNAVQQVGMDFRARPSQLRIRPQRWEELCESGRIQLAPSPVPWESGSVSTLFGIAVILADDLRLNQWRLCHSDGSLAFDSLSGKTLREVLDS